MKFSVCFDLLKMNFYFRIKIDQQNADIIVDFYRESFSFTK